MPGLLGGGASLAAVRAALGNDQGGQIYRALVKEISDSAALLQIGQHTLRAPIPKNIVKGQTVLLKMNHPAKESAVEIIRALPMESSPRSGSQVTQSQVQLSNQAQALIASTTGDHPGQVFRAVVKEVNGKFALLQAEDQTLRAPAPKNLLAGQAVLLKLAHQAKDSGVQIIRTFPLDSSSAGVSESVRQHGTPNNQVQALMSKQQSPQTVLNLARDMGNPGQYPPAVAAALSLLAGRQLPVDELLSPTHLREAANTGGLQLEAKLASSLASGALPADLGKDIKLVLQQLLAGLNAEPDLLLEEQGRNLQHAAEGLLARIGLQQMNSALQSEQGRFLWTVDLPWENNGQEGTLFMRISREQGADSNKPDGADQSWHVEVATELNVLGSVKASLFLRDNNLSVSLEAEQEQTLALFRDHLPTLEDQLNQQGFQVQTLLSRPAETDSNRGGEHSFDSVITVQA